MMKKYFLTASLMAALVFLAGCSEVELISHVAKRTMPPARGQGTFKVGNPYKVEGKTYYPEETYEYEETGIASWYGKEFEGRKTANGEIFDSRELTAAHRTLQMPSLVRVTNLDNGRSLIVRINDRGPYKRGRVMDVSARAAELLGFKNIGTAKVKLQLLQEESQKIAMAAKSGQDTSGYELAMNQQPNMYNGNAQPVAKVMTGGVPYQTAAASGYSTSVQSYPLAPQGAPVPQVVTAYAPNQYTAIVPGHERNGNFYPDPIVTEMPVRPSNIYVQAGSFSVADNANKLAASLQGLGTRAEVRPALIAGRQFFRVRIGPVGTVDQADALLSRVVNSGNKNAIIVVE